MKRVILYSLGIFLFIISSCNENISTEPNDISIDGQSMISQEDLSSLQSNEESSSSDKLSSEFSETKSNEYSESISIEDSSSSSESEEPVNNSVLLEYLQRDDINTMYIANNKASFENNEYNEIIDKELFLDDLCIESMTFDEYEIINSDDNSYNETYLTYTSSKETDYYVSISYKSEETIEFYINKKGIVYFFSPINDNVWYKSEETVSLTSLLYNVGLIAEKPTFSCIYSEVFDYLVNESIHSITLTANENYYLFGSPSDKLRTRKEQSINIVVDFFKDLKFEQISIDDDNEKYQAILERYKTDIFIDVLFNNYKFASLYVEKESGYVYCIDVENQIVYYSTTPININLFKSNPIF